MSCDALYVQVLISDFDTEYLHKRVSSVVDTSRYPIHIKPVHMTVCYHRDLPAEDFDHVVQTHYKPLEAQEVSLTVLGLAIDEKCVAYMVKPTSESSVQVFPANKNCHLTTMLNNAKPVYSNELIARLKSKGVVTEAEKCMWFQEPFIVVKGVVNIVTRSDNHLKQG